MPLPKVLHFGGNGHASVRLNHVREVLVANPSFELIDIPYPGFEGRSSVHTRDEFFDQLKPFCKCIGEPPAAAIASGIGALITLGLRTRGELVNTPLIFQGPVLWGLENRLFPKLMKPRLARSLLKHLFTYSSIQNRFVRRHFRQPLDQSTREQFFEGYRDCSLFSDFFDWFNSPFLRQLETQFALHPEQLQNISVWIGEHDRVVGRAEIDKTERALGVSWPIIQHPSWGHYPAIDTPEEWVKALQNALEKA